MAGERPDHTLDSTALVHEAYLRLVGRARPHDWSGRGHFFAAAAEAMRRILVEAARRKKPAGAAAAAGRPTWPTWTWPPSPPTRTSWPSTRPSTDSPRPTRRRPSWLTCAFSPA